MVKILKYNDNIWDSGIKIIKKPRILIPYRLLSICNAIQRKVGHNEFSILVKGAWNSEGFKLSTDFVIPKQEVGGASVDYKEDLTKYKQQGYNAVIHSHPFKSSSFSYADDEHINSHFRASVLYSMGDFTTAVISIQINEHLLLQVEAEVEVMHEEEEIDIDISNIQEKYEYYRYYNPRWRYEKNKKSKDKEEDEEEDDYGFAYY